MVSIGQLRAPGLAEGRRAEPQIDDRVEYGTRGDAHELALRVRDLQVHAAQCPLRRAALIVLNEVRGDSGFEKLDRLPGFHEEAAGVAEHLRLDEYDVGNRSCVEFHGLRSSCTMRNRYS